MQVVIAARQNVKHSQESEQTKESPCIILGVAIWRLQVVNHELEDKDWTQSRNLNDTKLKSVLQYAPSCHTHDFFPHWFFVGVIPAFLKSFRTVLHHPVVDLAIKILCLLFVSKEAKILRFDLVCLLGKGHKFIQPSLGYFLEEAAISPEISIVCINKSLRQ